MEESSLQFFLGLAALAWGIFTGWRNSKQPENINEEQAEPKNHAGQIDEETVGGLLFGVCLEFI